MRAIQESEEKTDVPAFQALVYQEFARHGTKAQIAEKIETQL
jgi:hypothetical protein